MPEIETPVEVAETPAAEAVEQVRPLGEPAKPDKGGFVWGTGRRKSSVARVRVKPGDGKFLVNKRDVNEYFSELQHKDACNRPLTRDPREVERKKPGQPGARRRFQFSKR